MSDLLMANLHKSFQELIDNDPPPNINSDEWNGWITSYYTKCLEKVDFYLATTVDKGCITLLKKEKNFLSKALHKVKTKMHQAPK